jgi:hypothetical protein
MHSTESVKPRKPKSTAASTKADKSSKLSEEDKAAAKPVKPDKSETASKPAAPPKEESDDDPPRPRPAWVNAEPRVQGGVYLTTRKTDPHVTTLECERDVSAALQSAVSEYAQALMGDAGYVRLSASDMARLERDRWDEPRTIEIGGESKPMHTLHLLIGFDKKIKEHILDQAQNVAENVVVAKRLKGVGFVLGGVLGLLALSWGVLRLITKDAEKAKVGDAAPT